VKLMASEMLKELDAMQTRLDELAVYL